MTDLTDHVFLSIPQTAQLLGYKTPHPVYALIRQGLPSVRLNGHLRVHGPGLREWAARITAEQLAEREEAMANLLPMRRRGGTRR